MLAIREDDLSGEATRALHLAGMHANSPSGHVFVPDLSDLQAPNMTVLSAWSRSAESFSGRCFCTRLTGG